MGKPSVQALPCRAIACACVADGALAGIVLAVGCRLVRAIAHFRLTRFSGDDDEGGSGELLANGCIGWRSEKFRFNRGRSFARARIRCCERSCC